MPEKDSEIVYHYCSLETFKSIIENKCLWLCDVEKSNDSAERVYFNNLMLQTVKQYMAQLDSSTHNIERKRAALQQLQNALSSPQDGLASVYSCSFSDNGDILSQWRGYADDGYGVSIGIYSGHFQKYLTKGCFRHIEYNEAAAKDKCKELLERGISSYLETNNDEEWDAVSSFSLYVLLLMEQQNIFYKSAAFIEEQECRIVTSDNLNTYSVDGNTLGFPGPEIISNKEKSTLWLSEKKFRVSNHKLSGYFELSFERIKDCFIENIILGPKCLSAPRDIRHFLECNNYKVENIEINTSSATYR